jgi:cytidylate kinase
MDIYEIIYYPQLCAEIDAAITSAVVNEIRMAGRCILEGHAAGLLCYEGPAFRVLLHAPWCVRVDRMTRRDGFSAAETVRKLNSLDTYTIQRFKDMFGAEINDTSSYEISIDTSADEPNQLVGIVIDAVDRWERAHGSAIAH